MAGNQHFRGAHSNVKPLHFLPAFITVEKVPRIKELKEKPLLDKKDKSILKQIMIRQSFFYLRIIKRTKHISMTNRHSIKSIHDNHLGIACIAVEKVVQWRYHFKWVLFLSPLFTVTQDRNRMARVSGACVKKGGCMINSRCSQTELKHRWGGQRPGCPEYTAVFIN